MSDEQAGKLLDGKYEVLQQLGTGGMGELYLVRHLHLEQERVVKILRKDLASDEAARRRFLREAQLATQVKHPNVATLYDFAQLPDGSFYMVWEYIDGLEIGQLLEKDGPMPLQQALRLAVQGLRGLEAIHSRGIIHRDVSPDNLMVAKDARGRWVLKIIDLGLAKGLAPEAGVDVTQAGMFLGKLRYCSPEQAEIDGDERLDARTDLYSFALVLYEMICGLPPFHSDSTAGFIFKRLSEDPLPLVGRRPEIEVPAPLGKVLATALQRDREQRFPTAIHFIEALEPIIDGLGAAATQRVEVPMELISGESRRGAKRASDRSPGASASGARPGVPPNRSPSQITRKERTELLAQIDRAARRVEETSRLFEQAEEALEAGEVEGARKIHRRLSRINPRAAGLTQLTERLDAATEAIEDEGDEGDEEAKEAKEAEKPGEAKKAIEEAAEQKAPKESAPEAVPAERERDLSSRIKAAEALLEDYLRQGRKALADLALSSLLEISPNHPRKADYEGWIRLVGKEATKKSRALDAVESGREALQARDFKTARKQAEVARKNDPTGDIAQILLEEIELAERELSSGRELEARKEEFEEALEAGELKGAADALEAMMALGLTRVAATFFRGRLQAAHAAKEDAATLESYRGRVREHLDRRDFEGARSLVVTLGQALPDNPAPKAMLAEVHREEERHRRRSVVVEGEQRVHEFLAAGNPDGAALALKILRQMDPDNPRWKPLEQEIQAAKA